MPGMHREMPITDRVSILYVHLTGCACQRNGVYCNGRQERGEAERERITTTARPVQDRPLLSKTKPNAAFHVPTIPSPATASRPARSFLTSLVLLHDGLLEHLVQFRLQRRVNLL